MLFCIRRLFVSPSIWLLLIVSWSDNSSILLNGLMFLLRKMRPLGCEDWGPFKTMNRMSIPCRQTTSFYYLLIPNLVTGQQASPVLLRNCNTATIPVSWNHSHDNKELGVADSPLLSGSYQWHEIMPNRKGYVQVISTAVFSGGSCETKVVDRLRRLAAFNSGFRLESFLRRQYGST